MEAKHIPRPWTYNKTNTGIREILNSAGQRIAVVESHDAGTKNDDRAQEAEANARLIAASPELLEACKILLSYVESEYGLDYEEIPKPEPLGDDPASAVYLGRTAIAKAAEQAQPPG
jgi:hypothetical protein